MNTAGKKNSDGDDSLRVAGKWYVPVDRGFSRITDHWRLVEELPRVNADEILAAAFLRTMEQHHQTGGRYHSLPETLKPCLAEEFDGGTVEGKRNDVGFALATELRRLGLGETEALDILQKWNQKNGSALAARELQSMCGRRMAQPSPTSTDAIPTAPCGEW